MTCLIVDAGVVAHALVRAASRLVSTPRPLATSLASRAASDSDRVPDHICSPACHTPGNSALHLISVGRRALAGARLQPRKSGGGTQ
jgi:hypothetical protein